MHASWVASVGAPVIMTTKSFRSVRHVFGRLTFVVPVPLGVMEVAMLPSQNREFRRYQLESSFAALAA